MIQFIKYGISCSFFLGLNGVFFAQEPTNALVHEQSSYLQQHAHNPVSWMPWGDEAFEKAKKENKLVIISSGYSSCHWCHVMERESFMNDSIAQFMNDHFVCIKVDREERTEIDKFYLNAIHLINKNAGWPLNCFALADGRPFYGGSYYTQDEWLKLLKAVQDMQINTPSEIEKFADELALGVSSSQFVPRNEDSASLNKADVALGIEQMKNELDFTFGGFLGEGNKFPMSSHLDFSMRYAFQKKDTVLLNYALNTLGKMACGGLYDQLGGGFARYSIDQQWLVPHFEKMLYVNGQLLTNYSTGYKLANAPSDKELFKHVVYETVEWLKREMSDPNGAFYVTQDADSEGEEGIFYTWTRDELKSVLVDDFDWARAYFSFSNDKESSEARYVLTRLDAQEEKALAVKQGFSYDDFVEKRNEVFEKLLTTRQTRIAPATDSKLITAWNSLAIIGLVDAYEAFGEEAFLQMAIKAGDWLQRNQLSGDHQLKHIAGEWSDENQGFLDDYAFTIEAFIRLYQVTFDDRYLIHANELTHTAIAQMKDSESAYFFYSVVVDRLVVREIELQDLSMPSSNAVMAENLFVLGTYFEDDEFLALSRDMCTNIKGTFANFSSSFCRWGSVLMDFTEPFYEVALTGKKSEALHKELLSTYFPNGLLIGGDSPSILLLQGKTGVKKPTIFVCRDKVCKLPVHSVSKALDLLVTD